MFTKHQPEDELELPLDMFMYHLKKTYILILFSFLFIAPTNSFGQLLENNDPSIETTGDVILLTLPASALATTLIMKDKEGIWQFTKGFLLNQAVTGAMKVLINKERPFQGGDYAFPSGHTSTVFQSASFFHRRYGFKYSIPAYVLASFTAYSRLNAERHDGWDVLAGAVVGIGSTYFFTTPYQQEHMSLTFSSYEDSFLIGFEFTF